MSKISGQWSSAAMFRLAAILFVLVYATSNDYEGGDASSYLAIAEAAPEFPEERLPHHHAQRFAIPFGLGVVAKTIGASPDAMLWVASLLVVIGNVALMILLARQHGVGQTATWLVVVLFMFNPYSFRYYLCTPPMLNDTTFVLGALLSCYGLGGRRLWVFAIGVIIAAAARQTAILLIPGWLAWLYWGGAGKGRLRDAAAVFAVVFSVATYHYSGEIAKQFGLPAWNLDHVVGIVPWVLKDFNVRELVLFSLRLVLTFLMTAAIFLPALRRNRPQLRRRLVERRSIVLFSLVGLAILSQPILAGPHISLRDIQRLAGVALGPLLLALAIAAPIRLSFRPAMAIIILTYLGSFHHLFSFYGPAESLNYHFASMHLVLAAAVFAITWKNAWSVAEEETEAPPAV